MVDPKLPDTAAMESSWTRILEYLRAGAADRVKKSVKLTSDMMERIVASLEKRKGTFDPHKVTIRDICQAIVEVTATSDFSEEEKQKMEKYLNHLFTQYCSAKG